MERLKNKVESKKKLKKTESVNVIKSNDTDIVNDEEFLINAKNSIICNKHFEDIYLKDKELQELSFVNCTISNCNFSYSNLEELSLKKCNIFNCDFENTNIKNSVFEDCNFFEKTKNLGCNFRLADSRHSEFHRCDISLCNFSRSEVFQIVIDECQAQGCNFKSADFSSKVSRNTNFNMAALNKTNFRYSDFEECI